MQTDAFLAERNIMNPIKSVKNLKKSELILWLASLAAIIISFIAAGEFDVLSVIASLLGATSLIFVAKGDALGQLIMIIFAIIYAVISYTFRYYGEMLTYVGMTLPTAVIAMINWLRHPYSEREVEVSPMTAKKWLFLSLACAGATAAFGAGLVLLETPNVVFSIISVATSFMGASLTVLRSDWYAIAYALNDIVLIVLWVLASIEYAGYIPMVVCFTVFLVNDLYGFFNWQKMKRRQRAYHLLEKHL